MFRWKWHKDVFNNNDGKSNMTERFIRNLNNKIYKHMTTVAKKRLFSRVGWLSILSRRFDPLPPPSFFYRQTPICPSPLFIFFPNLPLLARQYFLNETREKHKNKLMWQSYFFIFRKLENNVYEEHQVEI